MLEVAVDIGGTFTDLVGFDRGNGRRWSTKVPSTPSDPVAAIRVGVEELLHLCDRPAETVSRFVHGTTVGTNAVLEGKGGKTGVVMTLGFEDTLEIGRQRRSNLYDLFLDQETPTFLAPRRRRLGVRERITKDGSVLIPLDEEQLRGALEDLVGRQEVQAIAVCYLFSFKNPVHELRTKEIIEEMYPGLAVSLSSEVQPTFREYERLSVTALDAYLKPIMARYLMRLGGALREAGVTSQVHVMQSRGGLASSAVSIQRPVTTLLSGPAAGVIGGKFMAEQSGFHDVITIDIGGTSADVALVREGKPLTSTEGRIRTYPLQIPMVDINTIGAGGGSIAWIDSAGGLRVGPQSAGASPGPACYGTGGEDATVTDASLVLGYLNPEYFAGGKLRLDPDAAARAVERVAKPLGVDIPAAASGIHRIVNANMVDAIRLVSIKRGYDPRQFCLVLFGGAGPVHGGRLMRELSIPTSIVPTEPGVLSAFGLLASEVEYDTAKTFVARADAFDHEMAGSIFEELDQVGLDRMRQDGVPVAEVVCVRSADMRYVGQSFELEVPFGETLDGHHLPAVVQSFRDLHARVYGHSSPDAPVEFVNLRATYCHYLPPVTVSPIDGLHASRRDQKATRPAYFSEYGRYVPVPSYDRSSLPPGLKLPGPIIVEEPGSTTVIYPGQKLSIDRLGAIIIE